MEGRQAKIRAYAENFASLSSENEISSTTSNEEVEAMCEEEPMDVLNPCNATVAQKKTYKHTAANDISMLSLSGFDTNKEKQTKITISGEITNALMHETKDICTISPICYEDNETDTMLHSIYQNNDAFSDASLGIEYNISSNTEDFMSENGDDFDIFGAKLVSMLLSFTSRNGDRQETHEVKDETELTSTCQQLTVLESRPKWTTCRDNKIEQREENIHYYTDAQPDFYVLANRNKFETLSTGTSKPSYVLPTSFNKSEFPSTSHLKRSDSLESLFLPHNVDNQIKCKQNVGLQTSFPSVDGIGNMADDVLMMRWDTANIVHMQEINKKQHQRFENRIVDSTVKKGCLFSKNGHGNESEFPENGNSIGPVPSWLRYAKQNTVSDVKEGVLDSSIHLETNLEMDCDGSCCRKFSSANRSARSDMFPCSNHHRKNGIQIQRRNGCVQFSKSHKDKSTRSACCKYDEISDTLNRTSYTHIGCNDYQCHNKLDSSSTKTSLKYSLSNHSLIQLPQNDSEVRDSRIKNDIDCNASSSISENHGELLCSWQNSPKANDKPTCLTHSTIITSNIFSENQIPLHSQEPPTSHNHPLDYLRPLPEPETTMSSSQIARLNGMRCKSSEHNEARFDSNDRACTSRSRSKHKSTSNLTLTSQRQIFKNSPDIASDHGRSRDVKTWVTNDEIFISNDKPFSSKSESTSENPFPSHMHERHISQSRGNTSEFGQPRDEFRKQTATTDNYFLPLTSDIAMFSNYFRTSKVLINPRYNLDIDLNYIHCRRIKTTSGTKPTSTSSLRKCGLPPCRVCGDKASGLHFGVNSCEACNEFFRRTLKKNNEYACTKGGDCDVVGRKRSSCSYCRFQKCLSLGMSRNAIKTGRYSHQKRTQYTMEIKRMERLKEIKEKEKQMTDTTQDLLLKYKHFFTSSLPDSPSPSELRSGTFGKFRHFRPVPSVDDVMTEKYMKEEAKSTEDWIRRLIKFVKHVTIFEDVTLTDQAALIRMSWFEIRFLDSFRHFCSDAKIASDPIRRFITFDQLATLHSQDLAFDIFRVADKLKRLNVSDDELVLIKCLYLTLSDRYILADQLKVTSLTEFITNSLLYTLEKNRHGNAAMFFSRIVDCFVELRSLAKTYFEGFSNFYVHHVTKNSQLLAEMIPVREKT